MRLEKSVQSPDRRVYPFLLWSFAWRAALISGFLLGNRSASTHHEPRHVPAAETCPPDAAPFERPPLIDAGVYPPAAATHDVCPSCHSR